MSDERWRPIEGHGQDIRQLYEVSDQGRVRSHGRWVRYRTAAGVEVKYWKPGRILRLTRFGRRGDYQIVRLCSETGRVNAQVHELVLTAFVGPRPPGLIACHFDGNGSNNTPENLRWDTYSANNFDRVRHGRHPKTSRTHCPRGHRLAPPNLESGHQKTGHRACRACLRALKYIGKLRRAGKPTLDVQETADRYYQRYLQESPADVVAALAMEWAAAEAAGDQPDEAA